MRLRETIYAIVAGLFTGGLSGLVGLGGAELRMPFILYLLGLPLREMVPTNMLISLLVSGSNLLFRVNAGLLTSEAIIISLIMLAGSVPGGIVGAILSQRTRERKLKLFIAALLSLVFSRLIVEQLGHIPEPFTGFSLPWVTSFILAAGFGFIIGVVAGMIGVAGGEYRIPVLIFFFGLPIKIAGTASQLVAVPTVLAGVLKHGEYGAITARSWRIFALMGMGSLAGVFIGTHLLVGLSDRVVELIFATILTYTIIRLILDALSKQKQPVRR